MLEHTNVANQVTTQMNQGDNLVRGASKGDRIFHINFPSVRKICAVSNTLVTSLAVP